MNVRSTKLFLHISNAVIAILCAAAILGYFILPLWQIEFSFTVTHELVDEIAKSYNPAPSESPQNTAYAYVGAENNVFFDETTDITYISEKDIVLAVAQAMADSDLTFSMSGNFDTSTFVGAIFDRSTGKLEKEIEKAVDKFASDAEVIISDVVDAVIGTVAKEVVKSQVKEIIKENIDVEIADDFLNEIGIDEARVDRMIDTAITAVTADDATVTSITDTIMSMSDEVIGLLAESEKYAEDAANFTDEDKAAIRDTIIETISPYADEDGRINLKEALVTQVLSLASDALSDNLNSDKAFDAENEAPKAAFAVARINGDNGNTVYEDTAISSTVSSLSYNDAVAQLKDRLKTTLIENIDPSVLNTVMTVMAVIGIIILLFLIMLAYPIIRALTKIGSKNPGFHLALPIIAGIIPFVVMVALPGALMGIARSGTLLSSLNAPAEAAAVLDAITVKFSSCTLIAFTVALVLFVYSFFYGHFRRKLAKALKAAPAAEVPAVQPAPAEVENAESAVEEKSADTEPSENADSGGNK